MSVTPNPRRSLGERGVAEAGEFGAFTLRTALALPGAGRYFAEIVRQAGILIVGTTLIAAFLSMTIGGQCALFGHYFLKAVGATTFNGAFTAICSVQELYPLAFGYIFAAKVGCGLVAELGTMRISEEIDALESVGINPMVYVVATRLAAVWVFIPIAYVIALATGSAGAFLVGVVQIGQISQGAFEGGYWVVESLSAYLYSLIKAFVIGTAIALVGLYYGFRARGGPVGVGAATARSMVVNIVALHVINGLLSVVFFSKPTVNFGG